MTAKAIGITKKMPYNGTMFSHDIRCDIAGTLSLSIKIPKKKMATTTPATAAIMVEISGDITNISPYRPKATIARIITLFFTVYPSYHDGT
jgi:hypothetical protein